MKYKWLLIFFTLLALILRLYHLGLNDLQEEENTTVKAAAYLYFCHQDQANCQISTDPFDQKPVNKLLVLLTDNETKPNLLTSIYLWDWIKKAPTNIHFARAWPDLHLNSLAYQLMGVSEFSSRIVSVLAGTLLIPVSFLFGLYFSGSITLSLVYSLLLSSSFFFIQFSRFARLYSGFILIFLLSVYFTARCLSDRSNKLLKIIAALVFFTLAYFYHLLALLLPVALLIYGLFYHRRLFLSLLLALFGLFYLSSKLGVDFFHLDFISLASPPHWSYLQAVFKYPITVAISLGLIILTFPKLLRHKKHFLLLSILFTYLIFLIFFSTMTPSAAYTIHLLPISWLLLLICLKHIFPSRQLRNFAYTVLLIVNLLQLLTKVPYLYFSRNSQAQPSKAYKIILDSLKPDDQILGLQVRDYYLKALPQNALITALPNHQQLTLPELQQLLAKANQSFLIWEKEKLVHLKPEIIEYVTVHTTKLAGEGIDNYQVEIYQYQK